MSTLVDNSRALMALLQPITGERATGQVRITTRPGSGSVLLPYGYYFWPVVDGQVEPQWLFKLAKNPGREDGCWEVTEAGDLCDAFSNIGGIRHNVTGGTVFRSEIPEFAQLDIVAEGDFAGATTYEADEAVKLVAG